MFLNIYKFLTHGTQPIRYGKKFSQCNKLKSYDEIVNIYKNKGLVSIEIPIHKFTKDYYIPAQEKLTFHLDHLQILGNNECGATRKDAIKSRQINGDIRVIKYHAGKYSESISIQDQSQHWGGDSQLPTEGAAMYYFNNDNIVREVNP